jgi:hypothetical protein
MPLFDLFLLLHVMPQAEVQVLVNSKEAPEVYSMGADDLISVGPFEGEGLDMRSSGIQGLFRLVGSLAPGVSLVIDWSDWA